MPSQLISVPPGRSISLRVPFGGLVYHRLFRFWLASRPPDPVDIHSYSSTPGVLFPIGFRSWGLVALCCLGFRRGAVSRGVVFPIDSVIESVVPGLRILRSRSLDPLAPPWSLWYSSDHREFLRSQAISYRPRFRALPFRVMVPGIGCPVFPPPNPCAGTIRWSWGVPLVVPVVISSCAELRWCGSGGFPRKGSGSPMMIHSGVARPDTSGVSSSVRVPPFGCRG